MKKKILFVTGSLNQTTQLHKIASYLEPRHEIFFTQVFQDGKFYEFLAESGFFDHTVFGKNSSFSKISRQYIQDHNIRYDYRGESLGNSYDLAVLSTDIVFPSFLSKTKTAWIQEGMIDPQTFFSNLILKLKLPRYLTGSTSLNGSSNLADLYFSASQGFKSLFVKNGTEAHKILCTGIPNFDDLYALAQYDFEYQDYVLVATSDIRELGGNDDRVSFLLACKDIAGFDQIIFKLHPNENHDIVRREILEILPNALIYTSGSIDPMIYHCKTLITQFSTVALIGLVLQKKVYSYFDINELYACKPIQNEGMSAEIIAEILDIYLDMTDKASIYHHPLVTKYL
ncbi:MAG: hypothetical protein MUE53_00295 [Chitinophagales bacterium]|jgi:hypothetical protein|nr:hypothetical protein [Chitinophagales bacterium]